MRGIKMVKDGDGPDDFPADWKKKERIKVDVVRMEPMGKGKIKIKIRDTKSNIIDLQHGGKGYAVIRNLGRGRYIMREIE